MSKVTKEYIDGMAPVCNYIIACVYVQNESLVGTLCAKRMCHGHAAGAHGRYPGSTEAFILLFWCECYISMKK